MKLRRNQQGFSLTHMLIVGDIKRLKPVFMASISEEQANSNTRASLRATARQIRNNIIEALAQESA